MKPVVKDKGVKLSTFIRRFDVNRSNCFMIITTKDNESVMVTINELIRYRRNRVSSYLNELFEKKVTEFAVRDNVIELRCY